MSEQTPSESSGIGKAIKRYLITGLLVWLPITITLWVVTYIVSTTDHLFNLLPTTTWFDVPGDGALVEAEVCRQSGCLKGRFCDASDVVPICPNGQRTEPCPYHIRVNLTPDGRFRVYENCMSEASAVPANWFVLPPAWEWYYRQQHPEYRPLPPFMPGCGADSDRPMQFI